MKGWKKHGFSINKKDKGACNFGACPKRKIYQSRWCIEHEMSMRIVAKARHQSVKKGGV